MDVDLRSVSLADAKAARRALQYAVDAGMCMEPETYVSVIAFKAMLTYRIAQAEKGDEATVDARARLHATIDLMRADA